VLAISIAVLPAQADEADAGPREDAVTAKVPLLLNYEQNVRDLEFDFLDLILVEGYSYDRDGKRKKVEVLDVPFASVYKSKQYSDEESSKTFVHVPFVTIAKSRKTAEEQSFKLLDVPFASLIKTESDSDGNFDRRLITVPILGPLFRHKMEGDKETVRFLFFKHSRTHVQSDEVDEPKRPPRRSNINPRPAR